MLGTIDRTPRTEVGVVLHAGGRARRGGVVIARAAIGRVGCDSPC